MLVAYLTAKCRRSRIHSTPNEGQGIALVVGPYKVLDLTGGKTAETYLLRYDEGGQLLSSETESMLRSSLDGVSDVFLFSHGWNNTFADAADNYLRFIEGYIAQRAQFNVPVPGNYQPLLVGVIWPSTSFVFPWDEGPKIAADSDIESRRTEEMLRLVTTSVGEAAGGRLAELVDGSPGLAEAEARVAAETMITSLWKSDADASSSAPPTVDELLEAWAALEGGAPLPADPDEFGEIVGGAAAAPKPAGFFSRLDPRTLLRMGTVWLMKDRAGKVGVNGVAPLVAHVLSNTSARLHMIGHSFGGRVVLSSVAAAPGVRRVRSMLLLEPAVNRWCFAADVVGKGTAGGYQPVLDRVELPILSTFSKHDIPLTQAFHLAVRGSSLGEPRIAAVGDTYRYGALGGYGPEGMADLAEEQRAIKAGSDRYVFTPGKKIIAINGGIDIDGRPAIGGHSDINNATTWWALHCLTGAG